MTITTGQRVFWLTYQHEIESADVCYATEREVVVNMGLVAGLKLMRRSAVFDNRAGALAAAANALMTEAAARQRKAAEYLAELTKTAREQVGPRAA